MDYMDSVDTSRCKEKSPFLGVIHSFTGRRWLSDAADEHATYALYKHTGLPNLICQILVRRGVSLDTAESYLTPKLRHCLPDPFHLKGMSEAAERLASAIMRGEIVAVFGDYDVDGATSAALVKRFIEAAGSQAILYIPDRVNEGYGPNVTSLLKLHNMGITLVVVVDCGTLAFRPLAAAANVGLDVVVVDHHKAEAQLPAAIAVVNPNRADETSPYSYLAAVGVAFLVIIATNRVLRDRNWYTATALMPNPMQWLDLVALGTVCDMVPLIGVNRALVKQGLKIMAKYGNVGISALSKMVNLYEQPDTWHLGFILGPRVNAGGRIGQADLGAKLLSTYDPTEALILAQLLDSYNKERQEIERQVLLAALKQIETRVDTQTPLILAAGWHWHSGVTGIVAGRLRERYNRPACVFSIEGDIAKGSGRSTTTGIDLGEAVLAARAAGLVEDGGGHAMAAGFTVRVDLLQAFYNFLLNRVSETHMSSTQTLLVEGAMNPTGVTLSFVDSLRQIGPFGPGNHEPRFALANIRVTRSEIVGHGHVRCILVGSGGTYLKAIAFRSADSNLGYALLANNGALMHVVGTIRLDVWHGQNKIQLLIEDGAYVV